MESLTRIDELKRQRKEIEAEIRRLKRKETAIGDSKIEFNSNASYGLFWRVAYRTDVKGVQWKTVVNGKSKQEVVQKLGDAIESLQKLYDAVREGKA